MRDARHRPRPRDVGGCSSGCSSGCSTIRAQRAGEAGGAGAGDRERDEEATTSGPRAAPRASASAPSAVSAAISAAAEVTSRRRAKRARACRAARSGAARPSSPDRRASATRPRAGSPCDPRAASGRRAGDDREHRRQLRRAGGAFGRRRARRPRPPAGPASGQLLDAGDERDAEVARRRRRDRAQPFVVGARAGQHQIGADALEPDASAWPRVWKSTPAMSSAAIRTAASRPPPAPVAAGLLPSTSPRAPPCGVLARRRERERLRERVRVVAPQASGLRIGRRRAQANDDVHARFSFFRLRAAKARQRACRSRSELDAGRAAAGMRSTTSAGVRAGAASSPNTMAPIRPRGVPETAEARPSPTDHQDPGNLASRSRAPPRPRPRRRRPRAPPPPASPPPRRPSAGSTTTSTRASGTRRRRPARTRSRTCPASPGRRR